MVIVVANRKGGAGKSTIACNMSAVLARMGKNVVLVDTDPQGTAGRWILARAECPDVREIAFIAAKPGKQLMQTIKQLAATFEYVMVDLQGEDSEENRYTMALADKIIIPAKPSNADLDVLTESMKPMVDRLIELKPSVSVHYVLNEAPTNTRREIVESLNYLADFKINPVQTVIHDRKAYRDSISAGKGACELGDQKAAEEITNLHNDIFGA